MEGGPIFWVAVHRIHHRFADQTGDPHTPRDGKWWAHILWMLAGKSSQHRINAYDRFARDLVQDRFYLWLSKYHYVPQVLTGFLLWSLGGFSFLLWGVFFRVTIGLHATWLVNSATHLWGARRFATRDQSRNNAWVALMTFGEGWHNNHHAHPTSARHGLAWYEFDPTWLMIRVFRSVGLARPVREASVSSLPANSAEG